MATHEREHLDRALAIFERTIADFPELPTAPDRLYPARGVSPCPILDKPKL